MMPDPGDFDYALRKATWDSARERWKGKEPPIEDRQEHERIVKADFLRTMARMPEEYLRRTFRQAIPEAGEAEVEKFLTTLSRSMKSDPLALEQPFSTDGGELNMFSTGANLEMGLYIAQMTGSYLFTNLKARWNEILSVTDFPPSGEVWSPLTRAIQALDFKFLDNVPLKFAYEMRQEGRLAQLRNTMRKIWGRDRRYT